MGWNTFFNNTLNELCNRVCVPKKTEGLNLYVFNIITGITELKTIAKHILCKCEWTFDGRKRKSSVKIWTKCVQKKLYLELCNM